MESQTGSIITRLQVLPAEIRDARTEYAVKVKEKAQADQLLKDREAALLADSSVNLGSNEQERKANLRLQTEAERASLAEALDALEAAKIILEERQNELRAAQATAFILASEAGLDFYA